MKLTLSLIVLVIVSFFIGVFVQRNKNIFPVKEKKDIDTLDPIFNETDPMYLETNVEDLISIHSVEDVQTKRKQLISVLWGNSGLPKDKMPVEVTTNYQDERYNNLFETSLERIDQVIVGLDYDLKSHIYHFIPKNSNNRLLIYHQGHNGDFILGKDIISASLSEGYAVAGFCMPLLGLNEKPTLDDPRIGRLKITTHEHMKYLKPEQGHPVKYFLEPIVVFINYAIKNMGYKDVNMTGISGGGWTTTLVTAVDVRIKHSFPVAGTYPLYLRSDCRRDWGDYEQHDPQIYRMCNYLEMYILGAFGEGRSQLQLLNKFDSCCFAGIKWETYEPVIKKKVESLGWGDWDLFMDDSHTEHKISEIAQNKIISILNSK